jgi:hypothetical protein
MAHRTFQRAPLEVSRNIGDFAAAASQRPRHKSVILYEFATFSAGNASLLRDSRRLPVMAVGAESHCYC